MIDDGNAGTGHDAYARSVVRVLDGNGLVVGAGFLVGPDIVATCAHVVNSALGLDPAADEVPASAVSIDFPMSGEPMRSAMAARVTRWSPIRDDGTGDVALLRLAAAAPPGATMPPLRGGRELWDHEFHVLGFPEGLVDGVWATGRIRAGQGTGWLQLHGAATEHGIDEGFSGAPVWDVAVGAVVGMTVARDRDLATTTAYVVPMAQVLGLDPELLPCPYRGLAPFDEEHAAYFHGRDEDVARLVAAAGRHPVVAVAGGSGTGKSSLLRAGLLPALREGGATVADCRPVAGLTAAGSLATALARPLDLGPDLTNALVNRLRADPSPTVSRRLAGELAERSRGPLVLLLDQFEEAVAADPDGARELLALVIGLVSALPAPPGEPPPLRAVLTVRWESLGSLLTPELAAAFEDSTVFVTAMSRRQLQQAIVDPAERAPGLYFEDGLVARILDDAGAEPGQLPLVESLLTQLWERRSGGRLTMRDYEAIGGVRGALVHLAEQAMQTFTGSDDPEPVRRLLTQLARPAGVGFARQAAAFEALEPDLQAAAHRLAAARLVVLGSAPDGTATVELAHQALIDHWPRLRQWLADDRDFLSWRQQLDVHHRQWRAANRDSGTLLRGAPLATALDWLGARARDVPDAAREYVRLSRLRQRRGVRRWRVAALLLVVLVLVVGGLAGVAVSRGNRIRHQLGVANAQALAQLAMQRADADPVTATQLALAAYRGDPNDLAARTALAREYLAMRSVDAVFPGLTATAIDSLAVSIDGRTAVVAEGDSVSVVTGLAGAGGSTPRWDVPGVPKGTAMHLSPDGRWLAGVTAERAVLVWDLARRGSPAVLARLGTPPKVAFSPDGRRLAWLAGGQLTVRDLDGGAGATYQVGAATSIALTGDPDQVVLGRSGALTVWSLRGARLVRTLPSGSGPVAGGADVLACAGRASSDPKPLAVATVTESSTGRVLTRFPLLTADCPTDLPDAMSNGYLVEQATAFPGNVASLVRVTDVRTGRSFQASSPPNATSATGKTPLPRAVVRGRAGPQLLYARSNSVLRIGKTTPDWFAPLTQNSGGLLAEDTRYVVTFPFDLHAAGGALVVHDRVSGARLGQVTVRVPSEDSFTFAVGQSVVVAVKQGETATLTSYTVPELQPQGHYTLPLPGDTSSGISMIAHVQDGRLVALIDGVLAAWDTRTHQPIGPPTRLDPAPQNALFRPGHPGQVAIVRDDGVVRVLDVATGRVVASVPAGDDVTTVGSLMFDPSGERVAAITAQHTLRVWSVVTGRPEGSAIPVPNLTQVIGFTADGALAYTTDLGSVLVFVDLPSGRAATPLPLPTSVVDQQIEDGQNLQLGLESVVPVNFPVTARAWRSGLCAFADRPFTAAERTLLPPGSDAARPCR